MSQDMSFAEALTEARQIIVQQSSRIKKDLEKIQSLQETIASLSGSVSSSERTIRELKAEASRTEEEMSSLRSQMKEATVSREQAEAVIDRQGQRLSQAQETICRLEQQKSEQSEHIRQLSDEVQSLQKKLPTQEDTEALASLSELLSTKKVSVPASGQSSVRQLRLALDDSDDRAKQAA